MSDEGKGNHEHPRQCSQELGSLVQCTTVRCGGPGGHAYSRFFLLPMALSSYDNLSYAGPVVMGQYIHTTDSGETKQPLWLF